MRGNGTITQEQVYRYDDILTSELMNAGVIWYRLRMMDADGSSTWSPIAEVHLNAEPGATTLFAVYPNPATDILMIPYSVGDDAPLQLRVYGSDGRQMLSFNSSDLAGRGYHIFTMSTARLTEGAYFITLTSGNRRESRQVVVRR